MPSFRNLPHIIALFTTTVMSGCSDNSLQQNTGRVRAIKSYYVTEPAGADLRSFSGTIVAAGDSALSFAVSGTVQSVKVNQGDRVIEGQVLAMLDPKPFELDVEAARSQLASAQASYTNSKAELERHRQLLDRGWVSRAAYDQAVAAFDAAGGELNLARSRLGIAERDLSNTKLLAPFDGVIARRDIEPFTEVPKAQMVFQINSEDAFEVNLSIPDAIIGRLVIGAPVVLDVSVIAACGCSGRVTEIGTIAGPANAVPVTATILQSAPGLLPGMAAEARIVFSDPEGERGYLVPISAIAPGDGQVPGYIFKYDTDAGVVRKTPVQNGEGIKDNFIEIIDGVEAGDIIAIAGVSFLRDGQAVRLMNN